MERCRMIAKRNGSDYGSLVCEIWLRWRILLGDSRKLLAMTPGDRAAEAIRHLIGLLVEFFISSS